MDAIKDDRLDGGGESSWVRESEVQDRLEKRERDTARKCRDEWITALQNQTSLTSREIAALTPCDVSFSRVSQIAREDGK
jgi:hypothetical protein